MSITFSTPAARISHIAVECWDSPLSTRAVTWPEAVHVANQHAARCSTCRRHRPVMLEVHDPAEVTISEDNASMLLDLLGLDRLNTGIGHIDGVDFLGRVLVAQAIAPTDAGRPTVAIPIADGGSFLDHGRPAGYAQDRLAQLRSLAVAATAAASMVRWS